MMNNTILKILVGVIALSLAACAGFFSIVGLSKLFAGAAVAVVIMASTLEASKLILASVLYQQWNSISKVLRFYLLAAIIVIASITSIGIYGFLSGAYQNTKSKYDLTQTQTDSLAAQKMYYESSVNTFKGQLELKTGQLNNLTNLRNSQEQRASQLTSSNQSTYYADRSATQTDRTIKKLSSEIDDLNRKVINYSDSASKMNVAIGQLKLKNEISSELGSLSYISKVLDVPMDNIVNILILLFIVVFDPLAICMVLVFNHLNISYKNTTKITERLNTELESIENQEELPEKEPRIQSVSEELDKELIEIKQDEITAVKPDDRMIATRIEKQNKAAKLYSGGVSL